MRSNERALFQAAVSLLLVVRSIFVNPRQPCHRLDRVIRGVAWQVWKRATHRPGTIRLAIGMLFRTDPDCVISSALRYAAWPEFRELQWQGRMLKPGDAVLAVGANVGCGSILLSDTVGAGALFAIEPAPIAFLRLSKKWRLNAWPTDQLCEVAVGSARRGP